MAISGAAISPLAVSNNPLLFYAMLLTNARLGQWVPNPGDLRSRRYPTFISALFSYFTGTPENSAYLYVTDGGHHDNTGIEQLLRRRCRVIVACDASWDPQRQFLDLLRLFRRMSVFDGIQFTAPDGGPVQLDAVVADEKTGFSPSHHVVIKIAYPAKRQDELESGHNEARETESIGWLVYVKSTLTKTLPPELLKYRLDNNAFPHDPTLDQFYDPRRFECYRALGYELGREISSRLTVHEPNRQTAWLSELNFSYWGAVVGDGAARRADRRAFNERGIETASTQPGVFVLYDGEEVVYIGSAGENGGIRKSLPVYLDLAYQITSFKEEVTEFHKQRQRELLQSYKAQYGKLPRYNESAA
jgi:hypothetical protein